MTDARFDYPVVLIIRDGWGYNPDPEQDATNAIKLAKTPCDDALREKWPSTRIAASGLDVGVPEGVMGNSEVGHHNIGAGRIVDQEIVRITRALKDREVEAIPTWREMIFRAKKNGAALHLMGLVSDAGVHAMLEHLYGLLELVKEAGLQKVFIHAFTDGRDTPPNSGLGYIRELEARLEKLGVGEIASVCGRFWSMDRDNRWERVEKAYRCLTGEKAEAEVRSAAEAVRHYYDHPLDDSRKGDEFIVPTWIVDDAGRPVGPIRDGDAVFFFNFRGDRPRELTRAFTEEGFDGFSRSWKPDLYFVTMTEYQSGLPVEILFRKPEKMKNILGMYLADLGISQFRCAETEKYPHVTFFFNDYREEPFPGEDRAMIPSPKVPTYDLQPEMSAPGVTAAARDAILSKKYGLVVVNYANPDMVGHTGSLEAAIKAVETVDAGVAELLAAAAEAGARVVVCADHGNAEQLWDPSTNGRHTAHTLNPVEVYVVGPACESMKLRDSGRLADIAPTVLELMGLPQPKEMTGVSLLKK